MIVYTCWAGRYSDRVMYAIFSTKELAEECIRRNLATAGLYDYYDTEPEEDEVDEIKQYNDYVVCRWWNSYEKPKWVLDLNSSDNGNPYDTLIKQEKQKNYYVIVSFNYDRSVMYKSARDKLNMLLARDEGI